MSTPDPGPHAGEIASQPYFSTPFIYTGTCWCGYSTGKNADRSGAEKALAAHCQAKNGATNVDA